MSNVILYLTDDNNISKAIDLYENESISYSNSFASISDFVPRGAFSREFRIPSTPTNATFFGAQHQVGYISGGIDLKRKIKALLTVDTLPIAEGHVQFKRALTQQGKLFEYEIAFFGEIVDAARSIGDKMVSQLDWSYFDHVTTYDNIVDINDSVLFGGKLLYTLTDKGQNWTEAPSASGRRVLSTVNPIYSNELTPAVRMDWILDKIFEEAGFTWTGATIRDHLDDIYYPMTSGNPLVTGQYTNDASRFKAEVLIDPTTITFTNTTAQLTGFTDTFDPSGSFASNAYTANGNFTVTGKVKMGFEFDTAYNETYRLRIKKVSGGVTTYHEIDYITDMSTVAYEESSGWYPTPIHMVSGSFELNLLTGDVLTLVMIRYSTNTGSTFDIIEYNEQGIFDSYWTIDQISATLFNQPVELEYNCPEQKQIDFVKDIVKMHNAVIVPDPTIPNQVMIIPITEFIGSGSSLDWTQKLDTSKDIVLSPPTDMQKRLLKWSYKEQGDVGNTYYKNGAQRVYGELRLNNPENDFAVGDFTIETTFGATPPAYISNTEIIIPKFINESGQYSAPGPRALYRRPYPEGCSVQLYNEGTGASALTYLPLLHHYASLPTDVGTNDLNWNQEIPLHLIDAMPLHTLWDRYWRTYIQEIYDDEQRIMEAYFMLSLTDVFSLKFNDIIWIKDSYWRVLELSDYIVADQQATKVKLIRILDLGALCQYTPYQINATTGAVTFIDAAAATSYGSEECCTFYGYRWDTAKGKCFATTPNTNSRPVDVGTGKSGLAQLTNYGGEAKSLTGLGNSSNSVIEDANSKIIINGDGHVVKQQNDNSFISGQKNTMSEGNSDSVVLGKFAHGELRGVHFGGGTWYNTSINEGAIQPGRNQHGFVQLMGQQAIPTASNSIQMYVDGESPIRIVMPTETVWMAKCYVSLMEYDYTGTEFTGNVLAGEWSGMFYRDKTTHYTSKMIMQSRHGNGFSTGNFDLYCPVVSNQIAPYVDLKHSGHYALVSMTVQYTQVKFQKTPII